MWMEKTRVSLFPLIKAKVRRGSTASEKLPSIVGECFVICSKEHTRTYRSKTQGLPADHSQGQTRTAIGDVVRHDAMPRNVTLSVSKGLKEKSQTACSSELCARLAFLR